MPQHDGQCSAGLGRHWWAVVTHPQPTTHTHTHTHTQTHSQTHTAGQSFFTRPCGPLTGLGEGLPPCEADWQDWHLRIATLIMGICSDAPVWGPSRVLGCCHRDGGEPLVVFFGGQTETPLFSWGVARHDPPRLASFDLGGKQRAASQERDTSVQVHFVDCGCRSCETGGDGEI